MKKIASQRRATFIQTIIDKGGLRTTLVSLSRIFLTQGKHENCQ
jgi:hypothetical protein